MPPGRLIISSAADPLGLSLDFCFRAKAVLHVTLGVWPFVTQNGPGSYLNYRIQYLLVEKGR